MKIGFFLALAFLPAALHAQFSARVESVELNKVETPAFENVLSDLPDRSAKLGVWREALCEFVLTGVVENDIVPKVIVDFHVFLSDGRVLEQRVRYENVEIKEKWLAAVYISPARLKALQIDENPGVKILRTEIVIRDTQGRELDGRSTNGVRSLNYPPSQIVSGLRQKSQTPFAPLWWDRFAEESLKAID